MQVLILKHIRSVKGFIKKMTTRKVAQLFIFGKLSNIISPCRFMAPSIFLN